MASRRAKCLSRSSSWAGHDAFGQRRSTSPSGFTTAEPQDGQTEGGVHGGAPAGRFSSTTRTTLGITSPPRSISTVSPTRTSLRAISSSLWSVARRHRGAREVHRPQSGDGRQLPGSPHLHLDRLDDGGRLHRRVLVGDRPPRELRREAELLLQRVVVDLHHDAVDVVLERAAGLAPLLQERHHLAEAPAAARRGVRAEAPATQHLERLPLPADGRAAADVGDLVEEHVEAARGDDARVEVLHRPRRRIPRVRERLLALLLALEVDRVEARARQVHLAACLELVRDAVPEQDERDRPDRAGVRRHVVAAHAVAAGHRPHEPAALVVEGHRQAVDLQLRGVGDLALAPEHAEDPLLELPQLVLAVSVVEREHRHAVDERRELVGRLLPHPLGRAVGGDELGVLGLEPSQLALERVVLVVGDLGPVERVVQVLVAADLLPQRGDPLLGRLARRHGDGPGPGISDRGRG